MRALIAILTGVIFQVSAGTAFAEIENVSAVGHVVRYSIIDHEKSLESYVEFEQSRRRVFEIEAPNEDGDYYSMPVKAVVQVNSRQLEELLKGNFSNIYIVYNPNAYSISSTCLGRHLIERVPQLQDDGTLTMQEGCVVIYPTQIIIEPVL